MGSLKQYLQSAKAAAWDDEKTDSELIFNTNSRKQNNIGKLDDLVASKITKGILNGLKYLHDKNIVHRDLKPENVLLFGRKSIETAKIWDFGLAKELEPGIEGLTSELCGTLLYKAPEQLLGTSYSKVSFPNPNFQNL